ncbi:MAG: carbohydrate kinase [Verrucomicrobia bacterium]|nr:carbohydrate kinase [Verrucomicrobiota bacterium]
MKAARFGSITGNISKLRLAVVGDFCLDRYLEIDPEKKETSIETGLPVHNVTRVRSQPGGAGTILNNLVELGVREVFAVGFCGEDGEGWELKRALQAMRGVRMDHFVTTAQRRTFTYTKPLLSKPPAAPVELNRLDFKNWVPTSPSVVECVQRTITDLSAHVDGLILLDQVDIPETGVLTENVLQTIEKVARSRGDLLILADSRQGLGRFPNVTFKMNHSELARLTPISQEVEVAEVRRETARLSKERGYPVFVTLAEAGMVGASASGESEHVPALPTHGEIDIVGAGDSVTANLAVALAAGASLKESMEIASAAASLVIHQLGTTGTASVDQIREILVK